MPADIMSKDATIATVWRHLTPHKKYVANVLAKMRKCRTQQGGASVRIGITGTGQKPYFRIFSEDSEEQPIIFGSFYDNGDPLENGFANSQNWSTASSTLEELENFYADKIGYNGKRPR